MDKEGNINSDDLKETKENQEVQEENVDIDKEEITKHDEEIENVKEESEITEVIKEENLQPVETKLEEERQSENLDKENDIYTDTQEFKQVETSYKREKKKIVALIGIAAAIILIMFFSIVFALFNMNNTKILKGVSILGIDVSNLSLEEAKQKINETIEQKFTNEKENIILKRGETEISVNANTFNAKFDIDKAVAQAYNIGRSGNIITNNYSILYTSIFKKNIEAELNYDEKFMEDTINDINSKMENRVVEYSYFVKGEKLTIVSGKAGDTVETDKLTNEILEQLKDIHNHYEEIEIPVIHKEPDPINLEKIRSEIYKEAKNAYIEKNPTRVHVEENGVDFGISMEEAKKLIQEEKEKYEIPLKITIPKKKIADLGKEAFPDQLSTFSTIYDASVANRAHNIELAAKNINGTVVMPGETFSYNKVVGPMTLETGFKEGTSYIGGKIVPDVGGGVCQVSSTLYNAALLANLEIKERTNHMFTVGYVAASRDATVYYGSLDFVFKNTRTYPVKVVASAKNGVCRVSLYGIKEKVEYEVIIQSKVTSYINFTTTYKEDASLAEGKEVVEQAGFNGCRSEGYKILKLNGKIVSQTLLSKDNYSPQERIVRRGTKKVVVPPKQPTTSTTTTTPATN